MKTHYVFYLCLFLCHNIIAQDSLQIDQRGKLTVEQQALAQKFKGLYLLNQQENKGTKSKKKANKKAMNALKKAIRKNPKDLESVLILIEEYIEVQEFDKARELLELFNQSDPKFRKDYNALINYYWGLYYSYRENIDDLRFRAAIKNFKKAIHIEEQKTNPNPAFISDIYNNLAYISIMMQATAGYGKVKFKNKVSNRDLKEAKNYLERALHYNPNNNTAKWNKELLSQIEYYQKEHNVSEQPERQFNRDEIIVLDEDDIPLANQNSKKDSISDTIRTLYKFQYLPNNANLLLRQLSQSKEILLLFDISGSMSAVIEQDGEQITRFESGKNLCLYLIQKLPKKVKVGMLTIGGHCEEQAYIETATGAMKRQNLAEMVAAIQGPYGSTPLDQNLFKAPTLFSEKASKKKGVKSILFLTDGANSCEFPENTCELSKKLAEQKIQINVLSFLVVDQSFYEYGVYHCMVTSGMGQVLEINSSDNTIVDQTIRISRSYSRLLPKNLYIIPPNKRVPIEDYEKKENEGE